MHNRVHTKFEFWAAVFIIIVVIIVSGIMVIISWRKHWFRKKNHWGKMMQTYNDGLYSYEYLTFYWTQKLATYIHFAVDVEELQAWEDFAEAVRRVKIFAEDMYQVHTLQMVLVRAELWGDEDEQEEYLAYRIKQQEAIDELAWYARTTGYAARRPNPTLENFWYFKSDLSLDFNLASPSGQKLIDFGSVELGQSLSVFECILSEFWRIDYHQLFFRMDYLYVPHAMYDIDSVSSWVPDSPASMRLFRLLGPAEVWYTIGMWEAPAEIMVSISMWGRYFKREADELFGKSINPLEVKAFNDWFINEFYVFNPSLYEDYRLFSKEYQLAQKHERVGVEILYRKLTLQPWIWHIHKDTHSYVEPYYVNQVYGGDGAHSWEEHWFTSCFHHPYLGDKMHLRPLWRKGYKPFFRQRPENVVEEIKYSVRHRADHFSGEALPESVKTVLRWRKGYWPYMTQKFKAAKAFYKWYVQGYR